ncbi:MAG: hypothetical protein O3C34_16940 [Proteobacteria bacterium]|nr:hypothetical protein [Pseudomonadota bacterium]
MRRPDTAALGLLMLLAAFIGLDSVGAPSRSERLPQKPADETTKPDAAKKAAGMQPIVLPLPPPPVSAAPAPPPKSSAPASPPSKTIAPLQPTEAQSPVPPARIVTALKPEPRELPQETPPRIAPPQTEKATAISAMSRTPAKENAASISRSEKPVEIAANGNLGSGRVMLRLLEHDAGPKIRLIWPDDAGQSAALYRHLSACFGMVSAVMTAEGRLFRESDTAGQPWALDIDRFSGFIRAAEGVLPSGEQRVVRNIRARHRVGGGAIVRVFPRWVDAGLLTGMQAIAGPVFRTAKRVDARYVAGTNGLEIIGMTIDGKAAGGRVRLRTPGSCG